MNQEENVRLLLVALEDVVRAATAPVNDRNITEATRRADCAVIAKAALRQWFNAAVEVVNVSAPHTDKCEYWEGFRCNCKRGKR